MESLFLTAAVNGKELGLGEGGLIAVVAIAMVFLILALIIAITFGAGKIIEKFAPKKEVKPVETATETAKLDLTDEDAVVATLVASIDMRNETNKNVKVISVKEIK